MWSARPAARRPRPSSTRCRRSRTASFFASDRGLADALAREDADDEAARATLHGIGAALADRRNVDLAHQANRYPPVWKSFDPQGHRVDAIEFHPAWHALMEGIVARGFHASPWEAGAPAHAHTLRAAGYLMQGRVEHGTLCPTTMTYGAVAALRRDEWAAREWVPRILSRDYDPRDLPIADKRGALVGMGMTEKQGGSDVRTNTTRAVRSTDGGHRLAGHKWFFSAPQCDAHLVLAYAVDEAGADEGLTCFLVPRFAPDGTRNAVRVQRLKDKLGNRSNASSRGRVRAVRGGGASARRGAACRRSSRWCTFTRLDCVIGTAAG